MALFAAGGCGRVEYTCDRHRPGPPAKRYIASRHLTPARSRASADSALAQREAELREQIARQPESPRSLYQLALVLRQEGKPRESLDAYTQAARSRVPTANELRSVALDYVLLNDYEDAIRWLERAFKMEPNNVDVLYSLGRCYYSKDRYVDAGKMYERVLAVEPTHLKAEENLGLVLDATNHPEEAEEALRKAATWAAGENKDEWPFLDLGGFLLDRDRAAEAIDPLRTAVRIRLTCAACHEKLGRALLATNDLPGSIARTRRGNAPRSQRSQGAFRVGTRAAPGRADLSAQNRNLLQARSSIRCTARSSVAPSRACGYCFSVAFRISSASRWR